MFRASSDTAVATRAESVPDRPARADRPRARSRATTTSDELATGTRTSFTVLVDAMVRAMPVERRPRLPPDQRPAEALQILGDVPDTPVAAALVERGRALVLAPLAAAAIDDDLDGLAREDVLEVRVSRQFLTRHDHEQTAHAAPPQANRLRASTLLRNGIPEQSGEYCKRTLGISHGAGAAGPTPSGSPSVASSVTRRGPPQGIPPCALWRSPNSAGSPQRLP